MNPTEVPVSRSYQCIDVEQAGEVCIAHLRPGSLDDPWMQRLGEELLSLIEEDGHRKLLIHFGAMECLYSVLLGKLMSVQRAMEAYGGRLKLCAVAPHAREVFRICKLEGFFEFTPDRETGLRDW
jgi:anti-sigma B factor antagonist